MINLYDGELVDMLPSQMATQTQQRCISYALKKGIRLIIDQNGSCDRQPARADPGYACGGDAYSLVQGRNGNRDQTAYHKENADVASDSRYSRSGGRAGRCRIRRRGSERVV